MADIPDYAALQARIAQYIDDTTQTALIPGFIERAERVWDRTLFIRSREAVYTTTSSSERVALPTDCQIVRSVSVSGVGVLRQTNPGEAANEIVTAKPYSYSLQAGDIVFEPALNGTQTINVLYYKKLVPLSGSATTNWLLDAHSDLYLAGSLAHAYAFLVDEERAATWKDVHDETLAQIMELAKKQRYGGGPLIARPTVDVN